ncbi:MAG TPA: hypothetical protein VFJ57_00180 [Solirubrobacterales bacterium]|nr:hypothetical protein [Solirubrobacterales bacterium]
MEAGRLRGGQFRGACVSVAVLIGALALTILPAQAKAASPVLEFVASGASFPIDFTASGGPVTAALADFDSVVHCADSEGDGAIVGPRATVSNYVFTGCKAQGGSKDGAQCKTAGASAEEITAEAIEADLVYIDQAKHEVGMLLNPAGGIYMEFECGGEAVEASGPFLSPVGPIDKEASSFTATLSRSGAVQTPSEYENALGEKRQAIPMGKREGNPVLVTTGVELGFTIHTSAPLQIKAVTAAEIEAKQRQDEAAAAAAAKKRQDAEAALAAAVRALRQEEANLAQLRRVLMSASLERCRLVHSKHKRVQCEKRAKKKYGIARSL